MRLTVPYRIMTTRADFVEPMLALAVPMLPEGQAWSYELKFDGYRAIGLKADGRVQLLSRNGKDFAKRFGSIAVALEMLPEYTIIDGEIVAFDTAGCPSFNVLQNQRSGAPELRLYAFDVIKHRGRDLTQQPLDKRRAVLRAQVMPRLPDSIRFSETLEVSVSELMAAVREQGFEGIVARTQAEVTAAIKKGCELQKQKKTTFIEVILNQELGEPFRRDAMKKPVIVAGIDPKDMRKQVV